MRKKIMASLIVGCCLSLILGTPSHSAAGGDSDANEKFNTEVIKSNLNVINFANKNLNHLRWDERECIECYAATAGSESSSLNARSKGLVCKEKWKAFYSEEKIGVDGRPILDSNQKPIRVPKSVVDLRIVFGYQDAEDSTMSSDILARQTVVDRVTSSCADVNVQVCGFVRSSDDADIFEKTIAGPTGEKQKVRLRLTASTSSASDAIVASVKPNSKTKVKISDSQNRQSQHATSTFFDGLREADMLLYIGHARDGGGPDFLPAERRPNGTINYDWYRAEKPGLEALRAAFLLAGGKSPKILGFLACESDRWVGRLAELAPKSGLILSATPKIPSAVALAQAYATLDAVLWQRCQESFDKTLTLYPKTDVVEYKGIKIIPPRLTNFFND